MANPLHPSCQPRKKWLFNPKLRDSVGSHLGPLGFPVRMGRRNLFPGRLNGSRTAQIFPESPGRQCPTTETVAAACEEVIETPGALAKPGSFCGGPCGRETPAVPSAKTKIRIAQLRLTKGFNFGWAAVSGDLDRPKTDVRPWKAVFQHDVFSENALVRCDGGGLGPRGRGIWR